MFKASAGKTLPTSIIGSLPRPSWYTAVLGAKTFLEAMVNARYREQYEDAVSVHLRAQETAGLDICTDGDAHYDEEVGGMSWQSYPLRHLAGFNTVADLGLGASARAGDRGPRYLYRRRRALRRGSRRHELAELPVAAPGRVQHGRRARDLQCRRGRISARPHPARLSGSPCLPQDRGAPGAGQSAIRRHVEGRATLDHKAGQVRHHPAGTSRRFCSRQLLQGPG